MDARTTWYPWQEMRRLQREMEHVFTDLAPAWRAPYSGEFPPLNVTHEDQAIFIDALCPGVDTATLDVTVVGDSVTIRGDHRREPNESDERYHRRERPFGSFVRTVGIGERLDPDRTQATYTHGILRVQLARTPEATPKKIAIQH